MWLLDVNIPVALKKELQNYRINSATAQEKGWRKLENGNLISMAYDKGFRCLLTRDRDIESSVKHVLRNLPNFAIVVIQLKQMKESFYLEAFKKAWNENPIKPLNGSVIFWP